MVLLQLVIKGLFDRKMRTFLTSLSIIIGVASIFALMSFGASFPYTLTIVLSAIVLGMIAGYFQEKMKILYSHQSFI